MITVILAWLGIGFGAAKKAASTARSATGTAVEFFKTHRELLIIALTVVVVVVFGLLARHCYTNHQINKVENGLQSDNRAIESKQNDVQAQQGQIEAANSNREQLKKEVQNEESNSQKAVEAVDAVRSRDSADADRDARAARERFCQSYPDDSQCKPR